jgi:hypothetical protein
VIKGCPPKRGRDVLLQARESSRPNLRNCGAGLELSCPSCGARAEPGERFCGQCGKPLAGLSTPTAPPDPRSYTSKHLADKILTSRSAIEGERKQVTVFFADVKGSMTLAEQVDPEKWHGILRPFFPDPFRRRSPLRGDGQPVHRRRHHGALRCTDPRETMRA